MTTMNNEDPDHGKPSGLWACAECGRKFEPTDQMREAVAAERERSHELLQAADHIRAGLEAKLAALSAALAELVALKDMKDRLTELHEMGHGTDYGNYHKRWPLAWAAARAALSAQPEQTAAARDVLAERRRQVEVEGWTPEHDDSHLPDEMALAACCYCAADEGDAPPAVWPWDVKWWKPKGRRRNMVKAAALLLAEIERLDRAAEKEQPK